MTITEALAELKIIEKKIIKKKEFICQPGILVRQGNMKDPHEKDGGSDILISETRQSIKDLSDRKILIRNAIVKSNLNTELKIKGITRSVFDWLTWRRENSSQEGDFYNILSRHIQRTRQTAMEKGFTVNSDDKKDGETNLVVNINEVKLQEEIELHEEILGTLDGQLSLLNATTKIEL